MKKLLTILFVLTLCGSSWGQDDSSFGSEVVITETSWGAGVLQVIPATSTGLGGTLDSIIVNLRDGGDGTDTIQGVIYTDNSGPDVLVDSTAELEISSNTAVPYKMAFIEGATITASTQYYIGWVNTSATSTPSKARNTGGVDVIYKGSQTSVEDPFPASPTTDAGYEHYSLVWYTTTAGASVSIAVGAATVGAVTVGSQ